MKIYTYKHPENWKHIFRLMMCQMFSIGEIFGPQTGQFSTWTLLLRSHAVVIVAVCGFALSYPEIDVIWRGAYVALNLYVPFRIHSRVGYRSHLNWYGTGIGTWNLVPVPNSTFFQYFTLCLIYHKNIFTHSLTAWWVSCPSLLLRESASLRYPFYS